MTVAPTLLQLDGDPGAQVGEATGYGEAALRTLPGLVDALPALYLLGFVVVMLTDRRQRLGDRVADTVIVRTA